MKFTINKKDFVHYVQHVTQIVPTKPTMQIVGSIMLECSEELNTIKLVTTDLNITVVVDIQANVLESGTICISAKSFSDIVQALPESMIHFETIVDKLKITCEKSSFNLNFMDCSLFPVIPSYSRDNELKLEKKVVSKMIENTAFATGSDATNQMYSGIYCSFSASEQIMAATDSKRIAEVKTFTPMNILDPFEFVISVKSLTFLEKFLNGSSEDIVMINEDKKIVFIYENVIIISSKYEGKYPIYSVVFKKEHEHMMLIDKSFLKDAIRRVALLGTNDDKNIMKFDIKQNQIILEAINSELGNAKEVIDDFTYDGEPIVFGLNSKFVLSFLNVIESDEVIFKIGKATEPVWVLNNSDDKSMMIRFVVMPLRL
ncbi:MAG TPA: DNA polymerase III subunit beta, partial [Candidatus Cloacimonadota bacterium]|nr:DNA polymerase III subunit beta [Candidatus Cloacimonadota bacterium]